MNFENRDCDCTNKICTQCKNDFNKFLNYVIKMKDEIESLKSHQKFIKQQLKDQIELALSSSCRSNMSDMEKIHHILNCDGCKDCDNNFYCC